MPTTNRARVLRLQSQMAEMAERVGQRMRQRREELKLTQAEVALAIEGKTTSDQVSRWERGKHQPNDLGPIAKALKVDVAYFYAPAVAAGGEVEVGPTPSPFPDTVEDRLARMEQRLDDHARKVEQLLRDQDKLLQRQARILERIEAAIDREDKAAEKRHAESDELWPLMREVLEGQVREGPAIRPATPRRSARAKKKPAAS